MSRLTKDDLNKVCYAPWEICGMDKHCTKGCHEEGGCTGGCHILKMYRKLADYEDKEEQGLLKTLPCGIGADIYIIPSETNFRLNLLHGHGELNRVYHQKVYSITFTNNGWYMEGDKEREYGTCRLFLDRFFKETWFLTESEAEEALAKMGGK